MDFIIATLKKHNAKYVDIHDPDDVQTIYHLFKEGYINTEDIMSDIVYLYAGWYYENIDKNYELTKKHYSMAIEDGNVTAMNNLAVLCKQEGDYESAKKYYWMAIECGHVTAMTNLAILYKKEGDYESAKKYYLMAIEGGNVTAMNNLAVLYHDLDNESAKKYYLMAIEGECVKSMNNLVVLYQNLKHKQDFFEHCFRYRHFIRRDLLLASVLAILEIDHDESIQDKLGQLKFTKEDELYPLAKKYLTLAQENVRWKNVNRMRALRFTLEHCKSYSFIPKELLEYIQAYL
jgi:tetratricopeptide (TPR) repeat protein